MAEQCAESKILTVVMKCDECKMGQMVADPNAKVLSSMPPQFTHVCNNCGAVAYYPNMYPTQICIPTEEYRDFTKEEKETLGIKSTNILT